MRRMRWNGPLVVGALAALLVGCAAGGTTAKPGPNLAKSQVLHVALPTGGSGDIATLDPSIVSDGASQTVADLLYDPLVTLDPQMAVEDWGADRVSVSADGLTYTFHLRAHQEFANGTPVTAADYAYSMNRTLDPCFAGPGQNYLLAIKDALTILSENCQNGVISPAAWPQTPPGPLLTTLIGDSINAPDPATLVVTLAQPAAYFLAALTYPVDAALDSTVVGPDPTSERWLDTLNTGPTGQGTSGMFALRSWDHAHGKLVLKPNPHWWGLSAGKKPYLSEIDISVFAERSAEQPYFFRSGVPAAFQSGQFDVGVMADGDLGAAPATGELHRVPAFMEYGLAMDWTSPPLDNQDARLALCLAINRDALNQQFYGGQMLPTWHIVPQGMPGYNAALTGPDGVTSTQGDPAAARAHWQAYLKTLHGATPPALTYYTYPGSVTSKQPDQALAQQWQSVLGVTVSMRSLSFNGMTPPHVPLIRFGWTADYPDPQDFLTTMFEVVQELNVNGISVPDADYLLQDAAATYNPRQRDVLYNGAEQFDINAVAWCPLFQGTVGYLAQGHVHGWQMDGRGLTPNDAWLATYIAG